MRIVVILLLVFVPAIFAQEAAGHGAEAEPSIWLKWANFALLCVVLGVLLGKNIGQFFQSRSAEIQSGLRDAKKLRQDSEARVADIVRRVANLQTDMQALREDAKKEMAAEAERIRTETTRLIGKIQTNAEHEIASAAKLARKELKAYAGSLAIELAGSRIRERLTPATQDQLVQGFISQLASVQKATH